VSVLVKSKKRWTTIVAAAVLTGMVVVPISSALAASPAGADSVCPAGTSTASVTFFSPANSSTAAPYIAISVSGHNLMGSSFIGATNNYTLATSSANAVVASGYYFIWGQYRNYSTTGYSVLELANYC
jgi:hypothetical protein